MTPPGETLREILSEKNLTQVEFAILLGRPLKTVNEIINGKAQITPKTALQLEEHLEVSAEFWLAREAGYRLYLLRKGERE